MTSGPLLKAGAVFEGYRITKAVPVDGGSLASVIPCFYAVHASELRLDAVRIIYCMRPAQREGVEDVVAEFVKGVERLKALRLPELPEVEAGGFAEGLLWVAVQDVRGDTLKSLLMKQDINEPWPLPMCLRLVSAIARVFKAASEQGISHYGFTPYNVICSPDLELKKITGMGILQLFGKTNRYSGKTWELMYMGPEQIAKGGVVGPKTDIYSAGLLFYELCVLEMPFANAQGQAPSGEWLMQVIMSTGPEPLSSKMGCPEFVDRFSRQLLAISARRRADWQVVIDEAEATAERVKQLLRPSQEEDKEPSRKPEPSTLPSVPSPLGVPASASADSGDDEQEQQLLDAMTSLGDALLRHGASPELIANTAKALGVGAGAPVTNDVKPESVRTATLNASPRAAQGEAGRTSAPTERTAPARRSSRLLWSVVSAAAALGAGGILLGGVAVGSLACKASIAIPAIRIVRPVVLVDSQPATPSEAPHIATQPLRGSVGERPRPATPVARVTWEDSCRNRWADCNPPDPIDPAE